jgi:hypothetical protein
MSGETYVVGTLEIEPGLPDEKKTKIVEDFEGVLETDLIWDEQSKQYNFSHVNWSSHVSEDEIRKFHQKHKRHIKYISISLWYLSESDFSLHVDRSEHALVFGRWYKQRSATIKESAAYLFETLLPPTRIAAEV